MPRWVLHCGDGGFLTWQSAIPHAVLGLLGCFTCLHASSMSYPSSTSSTSSASGLLALFVFWPLQAFVWSHNLKSCSKATPELQLGPTIRGASNWAHDTLQASQKLQNLQNASIPFNRSRAKRCYWHMCTLHTPRMTWGLKYKYPA